MDFNTLVDVTIELFNMNNRQLGKLQEFLQNLIGDKLRKEVRFLMDQSFLEPEKVVEENNLLIIEANSEELNNIVKSSERPEKKKVHNTHTTQESDLDKTVKKILADEQMMNKINIEKIIEEQLTNSELINELKSLKMELRELKDDLINQKEDFIKEAIKKVQKDNFLKGGDKSVEEQENLQEIENQDSLEEAEYQDCPNCNCEENNLKGGEKEMEEQERVSINELIPQMMQEAEEEIQEMIEANDVENMSEAEMMELANKARQKQKETIDKIKEIIMEREEVYGLCCIDDEKQLQQAGDGCCDCPVDVVLPSQIFPQPFEFFCCVKVLPINFFQENNIPFGFFGIFNPQVNYQQDKLRCCVEQFDVIGPFGCLSRVCVGRAAGCVELGIVANARDRFGDTIESPTTGEPVEICCDDIICIDNILNVNCIDDPDPCPCDGISKTVFFFTPFAFPCINRVEIEFVGVMVFTSP